MAKEIVKETEQTTTETKFPIASLRSNCLKLFGVTTSTFDGATYGVNGEYSVTEMKTIIKKWSKKEV